MISYALAGSLAGFEHALHHLVAAELPPAVVVIPTGEHERRLRTLARALNVRWRVTDDVNKQRLCFAAERVSLLVCVGLPHILRRPLLDEVLCLNLHTSRLPDHRGRHPVNWALIKGDRFVGTTLHRMDEGIDTGSIAEERWSDASSTRSALLQRSFRVGRNDSLASVLAGLIPAGTALVERALKALDEGRLGFKPQPPAFNEGPEPRRTPRDSKLDLRLRPFLAQRFVNAHVGLKGAEAFVRLGRRRVRLLRTECGERAGEVVAAWTQVGQHWAVVAVDGDLEGGVILVKTDRPLRVGEVLK